MLPLNRRLAYTAAVAPLLVFGGLAGLSAHLRAAGLGRTPRTAFSGERALRYVEFQVATGPRVPGSPGWQRTGDWIATRLRTTADTVLEQRWWHHTQRGDSIPLRNLFAQFRPSADYRVLYVTHWDTRPVADAPSVTDPVLRAQPIPGANDGASGTALLLQLADVLSRTPPSVGIDLLFVDGEDFGRFPHSADSLGDSDVLIGSRYFASHPPRAGYRVQYGVLWDMIGDRDLRILPEATSLRMAPDAVHALWRAAATMGYSAVFAKGPVVRVLDDHVPLLAAGYRVIDVIDVQYPAHHTAADDVDHVSARSLQIVGDVATALANLDRPHLLRLEGHDR